MDILNELNAFVEDKFNEKPVEPQEVYQEFRVLVKVSAKNIDETREKLDEAFNKLKNVTEVVDVSVE